MRNLGLTGMNDLDLNQKFSLRMLENTIEINALKPISKPIVIECVDALGNTIYRSENIKKLPINVSTITLAKGLYFVKIWSNSQDYLSKKIVLD